MDEFERAERDYAKWKSVRKVITCSNCGWKFYWKKGDPGACPSCGCID